jgi:hypothetical protein
MLCKTCENLPLPTNVAGACRSCTANTGYFAYKLCEDCSEDLDQCERCEAPLSALASSINKPGPTAFRVNLTDADDGKTVPGMRPGEEIVVTLEEDQYSQTEWGPAFTYSSYFRLKANNGFTPYAGQYQKGTRELVFEVSTTGTNDLELEEKVRTYSWYSQSASPSTVSAPNGKQWKCTVVSK